ncbi:MAG TPA: 1-acyl-sn-glycerol-3-phosphate acyltransferase [Lacipirellulaceae bacterium]|jgi:1-acyl-sn-glycerol-3-phosphate acyltransferase|nr:1-acyl-sn-glycerol-3-phosphate acyltransferase [Lacipirellulaceae bacterium]
MHRVVIDEPYKFVPPVYSEWWPTLLRFILRPNLRRMYGVNSVECRHVERLQASLAAGHSILLAPNHSHLADPMVLGVLGMEAGCHVFAMASWHVFKQTAFQTFMTRRMGAFSILREGNDRQAIETAIDILVSRRRPLIVFPEGVMTRHNDLVEEMMAGPSFIARQVAKRLKKENQPGGVVIHPVATRYSFNGDLTTAVTPDLETLEKRLSWQPQRHLSMVERITNLGRAFLSLKEIEFLGAPGDGNIYERAEKLVQTVLSQLESQWHIADHTGNVAVRVKRLRTAILPELIEDRIPHSQRERCWRDLAAAYYVQQISHYPRDYILREKNLPERVVETVERLQEDFTDVYTIHRPWHAIVQVGEAIPIGTQRARDELGDPIMAEVRRQLQSMIDELAAERTLA